MNIIKYHIIFLLIFPLCFVSAQDIKQDMNIAINYYTSGDFEKAVLYFDKIYSNNKSANIYHSYRISLIKLDRFKDAEKLCKNQIKLNPSELGHLVELGIVYDNWDKKDKSLAFYNKAIDKIDNKTNYHQITSLALAFEKEAMFNYSLSTYIRANKYSKDNPIQYNIQIAKIYAKQGEIQLMIDTYLHLLEVNDSYLSSVQRGLENSIDIYSEDAILLKKSILLKAQKNPDEIIYSRLLVWYFNLRGEFSSSFIYVRAIDLKTKSQGTSLYKLGEISNINEDYSTAIKCYDEIIKLYTNSGISENAKTKRLKAIKNSLISGGDININELLELKSSYLKILAEIEMYNYNEEQSSSKLPILMELFEIEAYYLHKYQDAEKFLKSALKLPGLSFVELAKIKTSIADIYVLQNKVWEASLLFMQVEKDFKYEAIGHSAKFKNTKIYYYTGEFDWCLAQLDVLKASTSKLIANDAMDLSLLITNNLSEEDSNQTALKLFAKADLFLTQNEFVEANKLFDSIVSIFQFSSLNDEILYKKAEIFLKENKYNDAILVLENLLLDYSNDILADNALFMLGDIYENKIYDLKKAKECYKEILFKHKDSYFITESRKRFRKLSEPNNNSL